MLNKLLDLIPWIFVVALAAAAITGSLAFNDWMNR
jgi:hypothetical protein